jgi:hypothetical protein
MTRRSILFWTFWGMTGLLVGTFVVGGVHTALWLPRALKMRREKTRMRVREESTTENNERDEPNREGEAGDEAGHS